MPMPMTLPPEAEARLALLAARCRRQRQPSALLLARFGFGGAQETALAEACLRRLRQRLRADDEVHPLGGLDFALLLRRVRVADCGAVIERLQRTCSAPDWLGPDGRLPTLLVHRLVPPLPSAPCQTPAEPRSSSVPETPPAAPSPAASPAKDSSPA